MNFNEPPFLKYHVMSLTERLYFPSWEYNSFDVFTIPSKSSFSLRSIMALKFGLYTSFRASMSKVNELCVTVKSDVRYNACGLLTAMQRQGAYLENSYPTILFVGAHTPPLYGLHLSFFLFIRNNLSVCSIFIYNVYASLHST